MQTITYSVCRKTVSIVNKSVAMIAEACAPDELAPGRAGAARSWRYAMLS